MNLCDTCNYWERPIKGSRLGECMRIVLRSDVVDTDEALADPKYAEYGEPLDAELVRLARTEFAVTQDGSNYRADLRCSAEFGCVLHEPVLIVPPVDAVELIRERNEPSSGAPA